MSPVSLAAGAQPRVEADLVHGTDLEVAAKRLTLEEAARIAREAAARAWGASAAATQSFAAMLMNLMRWLFRVVRANVSLFPSGGVGPASGLGPSAPSSAHNPNSVFAPLDKAPLSAQSVASEAPSRALKMPTPAGEAVEPVKVTSEEIESVVARVAEAVPDLDAANPLALTLATTSALLDQQATQYLALCSRAAAIAEEMNAQVAALAHERRRKPADVYDLVLADHEEGGDRGAMIRQLHRQGGRCESEAAACRAQIENALLTARAQGLDVAALVEKTKVVEAIPGWSAWLQAALPVDPPPLTAEERKSFAIDGPDDIEDPQAPAPADGAEQLRAAVLPTNAKNEQQAERLSA